ncbi:MAG: RNA polymerase sigma factor [Anaerolineales bacterium]
MAQASDRDLVLRTRGGEVDAFGEIVRRYQTSVFNVCYRLLGERREAEDQAQEAFLRAYQRLHSYDAERPFGPWVRTIAGRLCLNHLERRRANPLPLDEEIDRLPAGEGEPEGAHRAAERQGAIRRALLTLPPKQRTALELRHFGGLSYAEIAEAMWLPLTDVKSHLFRGRRSLAEMLRDVV